MSDKYKERVRAIATEMAPLIYQTKLFTISWKDNANKAPWINDAIHFARTEVKRTAEAVSVALSRWGCQEDVIETYLKDEGLITDSAQEDKPDPCPQELRCHTRNHSKGACDCQNMGLLPEEEGRWPPAKGMENKPLDTTGKYFNVQCQKCGWTGSSEFLDGGGQIADTGDYGDAYCPNCGQIDPDEYIPQSEGGQNEH